MKKILLILLLLGFCLQLEAKDNKRRGNYSCRCNYCSDFRESMRDCNNNRFFICNGRNNNFRENSRYQYYNRINCNYCGYCCPWYRREYEAQKEQEAKLEESEVKELLYQRRLEKMTIPKK